MIEDLNEFDDGACIQADVCIIGAGAAGITLAREFLGAQFTVALLESGGLDNEPATQKLYDSEVQGLPHAGIEKGRVRILGGTSTVWGGQTLRLGAFDFQPRNWVPDSGWPIKVQDLDPYYSRAEQVLQLGPNVSYETLCARAGIKPLSFESDRLYMECSRWSPGPNFGTTYRNDLKKARNVSLILHANVTQVVTNPETTSVERVEIKTLAGKTAKVQARFFVVCCGGIESARLLLASNTVEKWGIGNKHDLVGRCFQDHVHIWYDDIVATDRKRLQNLCESFFIDGRKYAPLVTLGEKIQAEKRLLRIQGSVIFWMEPDSSVAAVKSLFRAVRGRTLPEGRELRESVGRALSAPGELLHLAYRYLIQKRAATPRSGRVYLAALCEMAPNPNSRITLSEARDPLGMPRARIDWRIGELERRTALEYAKTVGSEFERLGIGSYDLKQAALLEDPAGWVRMATDNNHHMGTTRMHENEKQGVVDSDCKVHGVDNLYVGSSAVFPSSASSHPTLTILALCIRIADRLKNRLNNAEPVLLEEQFSSTSQRGVNGGDGYSRNREP